MLVLSRKTGQRTQIVAANGQVIWVTVVEIDGGKIRLGFEADESVVIAREELVAKPNGRPVSWRRERA
jgi:carbon storage regulator CsrA